MAESGSKTKAAALSATALAAPAPRAFLRWTNCAGGRGWPHPGARGPHRQVFVDGV